MAFKWKYPKTTSSTLDEDLDLSSSDEDADILKTCINEDDLLQDDDDKPKPIAAHQPSKQPFFFDVAPSSTSTGKNVNGNPTPSTSKGTGEVKDREIVYDTPQLDTLSLNANKGNQPSEDFMNMDLDEICKQRNIYGPPKAPRQPNHRFHYDRPITGARSKFYNIDPRQNMSLDEIIKMTPQASREHHPIRRRQHFADYGRSSYQAFQHVDQADKLRKGVESITENHPDKRADIFQEAMPNPEELQMTSELGEWTPDPWHCVSILIKKGYSIYWALMKRKNCESLKEEEASRLYRCVVSYNHVQGMCEAGTVLQAKHGAAVNFLEKLSKEFPLLSMGKLPIKVDEALLLDTGLLGQLVTIMKEKFGNEYKYRCQVQSEKLSNNRSLHRCTLFMELTSKFEGYSYIGAGYAKLMAAKSAYEDLLKKPCPMMKVHIGKEQCTGDESLYRGVESQMVHCYDFSRATIVEAENVRTSMGAAKKGNNPFSNHTHFPRSSKCVQISYVDPKNQNGNQ